jgi:hypothetical protein
MKCTSYRHISHYSVISLDLFMCRHKNNWLRNGASLRKHLRTCCDITGIPKVVLADSSCCYHSRYLEFTQNTLGQYEYIAWQHGYWVSVTDNGICLTFDSVAYPGIFSGWGGGVQQTQLRTEGRENEDLGRQPPNQGFHPICKWMNPIFLLGFYGCIFHGTGNSAQLWQNFGISGGGGGIETPKQSSVRPWFAWLKKSLPRWTNKNLRSGKFIISLATNKVCVLWQHKKYSYNRSTDYRPLFNWYPGLTCFVIYHHSSSSILFIVIVLLLFLFPSLVMKYSVASWNFGSSMYEVVSKIFRTGSAIYTAVVVGWSTGPNRPNCEFRVLLRRFAAIA